MMGKHDFEYISMRTMLERSRKGLLNEDVYSNPHVIGNQDQELQQKSLDDGNNTDKKITLDNNQTATVVSDVDELAGNITVGLQTILNGFMEAIQGTINNIDMISVHIGDSAMVITVKVTMDDGQPLIFNINSESQSVQVKYDNFLELTDKNVMLLGSVKNYFNPKLMSQLQGAVSSGGAGGDTASM